MTEKVDIVKKLALRLISEECYDTYFLDFDFLDGDCFRALLSKGLGIGIIAGSVLVKVPQILKIVKNKSAEGINLFSVLLDLFAISVHMSYSFVNGYPFSAWGDCTFLAFQTATIAALVLFFGGSPAKTGVFCVLYSALLYVLMGGLTPVEFLWSVQAMNIPIILAGKLSQAYTNFKNGSTGQLSAATCFLLFFGAVARIFTSIQETGDQMMVLTYCVSTTANFIIVAQLMYYWNKAPGKKQKTPKKVQANAQPTKQAKAKAKKAD